MGSRAQSIRGSEGLLYDALMKDPCHCTFIQTHRLSDTKNEPGVTSDWGIMKYPCRLIRCNKHISLWGVDSGKLRMCGAG